MKRITVLTGGVGGAKLVLGLTQVISPDAITAIVNTGDDFHYLDLAISPDIDTLVYTLAGLDDRVRGWGRIDESWNFMEALAALGGEHWFRLGDRDMAMHVLRTAALRRGNALSVVTDRLRRAVSVTTTILPMTDDRVATSLSTDRGQLEFQRYFVELRCEPVVSAIRFDGAADASAAPGVIAAIEQSDAILIAPSNPYLSVDPILAIGTIRDALVRARAPIVATCPVVGGAAVKGPTAKLMCELGIPVTPSAIASHYGGVIDALLVDERDRHIPPDTRYALADTLMHTLVDRARVARAALDLAGSL